MNHALWGHQNPYTDAYKEFFHYKEKHTGYDFGEKVPYEKTFPPTVKFTQPLRWWSWDRPRRLRVIRHLRDHLLMDILSLGGHEKPFTHVLLLSAEDSKQRVA